MESVVNDIIRPLVAADGGDVEIVTQEEGQVVLRLLNACRGCPGAFYTIQQVITPALRRVVPEGTHIEVITT